MIFLKELWKYDDDDDDENVLVIQISHLIQMQSRMFVLFMWSRSNKNKV